MTILLKAFFQCINRFIKNLNLFYSLSLYFFFLDRSFLVANALSENFHIIFCSDGFCKMTSFTRAEVMQRSAITDFLHGPMTSQLAVNLIRDALSKGLEKHFEILYYRKDGKNEPDTSRTHGGVFFVCLLINRFFFYLIFYFS